MNTLSELQDYVRTLSEEQFKAFFAWMGEMMQLNFTSKNIHTEFKESRFKGGHVCVHCGSLSVVKNGHFQAKQRYKCKDCNKQFNHLTLSSLACTKLPLDKWMNYAKCMLFGMSIRKSAELIDVCVKTSFYMRHKILDCIREYIGVGTVKGIVEVDETFQSVSYKGWIGTFKGVSTKFLENYLYWFKWIQLFSAEKDIIRGKKILVHSTVPCVDTRIEAYKQCQATFL